MGDDYNPVKEIRAGLKDLFDQKAYSTTSSKRGGDRFSPEYGPALDEIRDGVKHYVEAYLSDEDLALIQDRIREEAGRDVEVDPDYIANKFVSTVKQGVLRGGKIDLGKVDEQLEQLDELADGEGGLYTTLHTMLKNKPGVND